VHCIGSQRKEVMKTEHKIFNGSVYVLIHVYKSKNNLIIKEYIKNRKSNPKLEMGIIKTI